MLGRRQIFVQGASVGKIVWERTFRHLLDAVLDHIEHLTELRNGDRQRRHEDNHIAKGADQETQLACPQTDPRADEPVAWEWGLRGLVGHQLDARDQPALADIAHMAQNGQALGADPASRAILGARWISVCSSSKIRKHASAAAAASGLPP